MGAYGQVVSELRAPRDSCQGDTTFVIDDWADVLRALVDVDARFLVVGDGERKTMFLRCKGIVLALFVPLLLLISCLEKKKNRKRKL